MKVVIKQKLVVFPPHLCSRQSKELRLQLLHVTIVLIIIIILCFYKWSNALFIFCLLNTCNFSVAIYTVDAKQI